MNARLLTPSTPGRPAAVLGIGRSGRAACRLLRARGHATVAFDSGSGAAVGEAAAALREEGIPCITGAAAAAPRGDFAFAVLSPGIEPESPMARAFADTGIHLLSEIELAWNHRSAPVIAITGTNGKTTTTALLSHLLAAHRKNAPACGNIGTPFSEAVLLAPDADYFVLEISSFQLETCETLRPKVAVWMNFSPNHLDRYRGVDDYFAAKVRIFNNQTTEDFAVVRAGDLPLLPSLAARVTTFSASHGDADFTLADGWIRLRGQPLLDQRSTNLRGIHNAENLMAALGCLDAIGLSPSAAAPACSNFSPPEHRCEPVLETDGVLWLNDSKSTTLDSLEKALLAQDRPVVLIAGGKDKGFGFGPLAGVVRERALAAVLIGEMKERIASDWPGVPTRTAGSIMEAVAMAASLAHPGSAVLFSPGTSSFDMFADFEDRGRQFKRSVHQFYSTDQTTTENQKEKMP